ncbi:hypothetical protein SAMN05216497_1319 [Clostridium cochlearium]|uniref:Uncharacterized protein n=1 Tax=Clostridium cochlearium TaxID=1494 RepID=A0ABY0QP15_CLOCO|nr:hypothetical protein [Clostridium cochlearium]SDL41737.1 hypothetical protein SAMN05216497_1319 [Clostridium cochlearium]
MPFVESDGKYITFSALGELVYRRYLYLNYIPKIDLSIDSYKQYKEIKDKKTLKIINKMFLKLLNEDLRKNNEHEKVNETKSDLEIMKEGNTAERIFYFMDGSLPKVCLIYTAHDFYENALNRGIAFKSKFENFKRIEIE